jgi:putative redox protein
MKHIVDMSWSDKVAFITEIDGHKLTLDAGTDDGGSDLGPRPKKLMLAALAGCTGIDVVTILNKMHVYPDAFNVIVEGDVSEEHPKKYISMKVVYQFKGENLPLDKLQKAVDLSQEKYCGVSAFYKDSVRIEKEIRILP